MQKKESIKKSQQRRDLGKVIEIKPDYVQAMDKRAKIFSSQVFIYLFTYLVIY